MGHEFISFFCRETDGILDSETVLLGMTVPPNPPDGRLLASALLLPLASQWQQRRPPAGAVDISDLRLYHATSSC